MWPFVRKAKQIRSGKIYFSDELIVFIVENRATPGGAIVGTRIVTVPATASDPDLFAAFRTSDYLSESLKKIPVNYAAQGMEILKVVPFASVQEMEAKSKLVTWAECSDGHFDFQANQAFNRSQRNQYFEEFGQPITGKDFGTIVEAMRNAMSLAR